MISGSGKGVGKNVRRAVSGNELDVGFRAKVLAFALLLGGFVGFAYDIDHPISYALGIADWRFLHIPVLCVLGCAVALCGGLLAYRGFLKRKTN